MVRLLVDNDLSPDTATALRLFDFDATSVKEVFGNGAIEDPQLFEWLSLNRGVWITHDIAAKRQHVSLLKEKRVNVLWVRGQALTSWRQFKIVVKVLDQLVRMLGSAHGAMHFRAHERGGPTPTIDWSERPEDMPRGTR